MKFETSWPSRPRRGGARRRDDHPSHHRRIRQRRWILQGDNKDKPDFWRPTSEEITGKRWLLISRSGRVLVLLGSPLVFALGASLLVFLFVVTRAEAKPQD